MQGHFCSTRWTKRGHGERTSNRKWKVDYFVTKKQKLGVNMNTEDEGNMFLCKIRCMGINCTSEFTPAMWLNGSTGTHTSSLDTVQHQFYAIIEAVSSEEVVHTHTGTAAQKKRNNRSMPLSLQKARTPTGKRPRSGKQWRAWMIWAKVNWSAPVVLFLGEGCQLHKKMAREQICLCVGALASQCVCCSCHVCTWWQLCGSRSSSWLWLSVSSIVYLTFIH